MSDISSRDDVVRPTFSTARREQEYSSTKEMLIIAFCSFGMAGLMIIGAITSYHWLDAHFR